MQDSWLGDRIYEHGGGMVAVQTSLQLLAPECGPVQQPGNVRFFERCSLADTAGASGGM